jgi:hypothetical protein
VTWFGFFIKFPFNSFFPLLLGELLLVQHNNGIAAKEKSNDTAFNPHPRPPPQTSLALGSRRSVVFRTEASKLLISWWTKGNDEIQSNAKEFLFFFTVSYMVKSDEYFWDTLCATFVSFGLV